MGWGEGERIKPGAKTRCNPWQEALRKVHCVGHPYDCQAAALPHWPLKQVVQHLNHSKSMCEYRCLKPNLWYVSAEFANRTKLLCMRSGPELSSAVSDSLMLQHAPAVFRLLTCVCCPNTIPHIFVHWQSTVHLYVIG